MNTPALLNTLKRPGAARLGVATLVLSAAGFVGILTREGYKEAAYIPTKGDVPTLGFGTTQGVQMGDRTDPVSAAQRALKDAAAFEAVVKRCVTAPLSQAEFDLWVNFSYNVGPAFCGSTIVKRLNAGDRAGACEAVLMWKFVGKQDCSVVGNKVCWGLWTDRLATRQACLQEAA